MTQPDSERPVGAPVTLTESNQTQTGTPAENPIHPGEEDWLDLRENLESSGLQSLRLNMLLTGGYVLAGLLVAGCVFAWHHWGRH